MLSCINHEAAKVEHQIVKSAKAIKDKAAHEAYKKAVHAHQKYHVKSMNHYKRHALRQVRSIEDMVAEIPHNIESSLCRLAHETATTVCDCFDGIVDQITNLESPCIQCEREDRAAEKSKSNVEKEKDKKCSKTIEWKNEIKLMADPENDKKHIELAGLTHESKPGNPSKPSKPVCPTHNRTHLSGKLHSTSKGKDQNENNKQDGQLGQPKPNQSNSKQPDGGNSKKTSESANANKLPAPLCEPEKQRAVGGACNFLALSTGEGLESFNQLRGSHAQTKFDGTTFVDPEAEDPHKTLFTTQVMGKKACMLFEGSGPVNENKALGHIFLTWNRLSKGPVFSVGDPYLKCTSHAHLLTVERHRAEFSSFSPDKSRNRTPYFTFTFAPHSDEKDNRKYCKEMFTWRAVPKEDEESDIQSVELREGDKKDVNGQLVAVWKLDEQDDDYIRLFYKVPEGYNDEVAKSRWVTALLLTSRCAMEYGMGSGQALI